MFFDESFLILTLEINVRLHICFLFLKTDAVEIILCSFPESFFIFLLAEKISLALSIILPSNKTIVSHPTTSCCGYLILTLSAFALARYLTI